jgi:hypothetical protein
MANIIIGLRAKSRQFNNDLTDQSGMKDIIKAGREINRMKDCGIRGSRIESEMTPEVNKILAKEKEKKAVEFRKESEVLADRYLQEAKKEGIYGS